MGLRVGVIVHVAIKVERHGISCGSWLAISVKLVTVSLVVPHTVYRRWLAHSRRVAPTVAVTAGNADTTSAAIIPIVMQCSCISISIITQLGIVTFIDRLINGQWR